MTISALALAVLMSVGQVQDGRTQLPPPPGEARLDDIVVEGRRLEAAAETFVGEVAAPIKRRSLARWHDGVCVGVMNLRAEAAQFMADRVSTVAADLGLPVGEPGCKANIIVIATDDARSMARQLVDSKERNFDTGASGTNQGSRALADFQESDRPVRWWQISVPTDSATGDIATRLPGQANSAEDDVMGFAPNTRLFAASRISTQIRDDLRRAIVIIDIDQIADVNFAELSDYVAMVSLAQINPQARTADFNSVLNLFSATRATEGALTVWDRAYLEGLYDAPQNRVSRGAQMGGVVSSVVRQRREASHAEIEQAP